MKKRNILKKKKERNEIESINQNIIKICKKKERKKERKKDRKNWF